MDSSARRRQRKFLPFFVLVMLERGRHSCVTWESDVSCTLKVSKFAATLGTTGVRLRIALDFLKRYKYLSDLSIINHQQVALTLAPRPRRSTGEAT